MSKRRTKRTASSTETQQNPSKTIIVPPVLTPADTLPPSQQEVFRHLIPHFSHAERFPSCSACLLSTPDWIPSFTCSKVHNRTISDSPRLRDPPPLRLIRAGRRSRAGDGPFRWRRHADLSDPLESEAVESVICERITSPCVTRIREQNSNRATGTARVPYLK